MIELLECPNCGSDIDPDFFDYCENCGMVLEEAA